MKKFMSKLVLAFVLLFTLPGCSSGKFWQVLAQAAENPRGSCGGINYELTGAYGAATFKGCADDIAAFSDGNGNPIIMELTINKLSAVVGDAISVSATAYELDHKGTVVYKPVCAITSPDTRSSSDDGSWVYADSTFFTAGNDMVISANCSFAVDSSGKVVADGWGDSSFTINATASLFVYPTSTMVPEYNNDDSWWNPYGSCIYNCGDQIVP